MTHGDSLTRSFMMLCFAGAALLLGMQWWQGATDPKSAANSAPLPPLPNTSALQASQARVSGSSGYGGLATPAPIAPNVTIPNIVPALPRPTSALTVESQGRVASAAPALSALLQPYMVVDLSDRQVSVYRGAIAQSRYAIAVGKAGWETPAGTFQVSDKQIDPHWQHPITKRDIGPGPDNPLGSRWIGFWTDGIHVIGFHGTNQTELIGQAVSHGCIRMTNPEIEALFEQVQVGTPVIVQP
jgi:lipoprotein-anchoring transpeptidase ErfK/SrfK